VLVKQGPNAIEFRDPGSPADKQGLWKNDIILEVNGSKTR